MQPDCWAVFWHSRVAYDFPSPLLQSFVAALLVAAPSPKVTLPRHSIFGNSRPNLPQGLSERVTPGSVKAYCILKLVLLGTSFLQYKKAEQVLLLLDSFASLDRRLGLELHLPLHVRCLVHPH